MPRWARILAGLGLAGAAASALIVLSGVVNVGASTGHWKITEWLLHFAMRRSVETHALGTAEPALDDPALIRRGAGHYALGCAPCHGAPGARPSAVAHAMTPRPPLLVETAPEWDPEQLFWIVRHGVKFTGMPAWPALQREDEVWAVVAFLDRLPTLDAAAYRRLAQGEAERAEAVVGDRPRSLGRCAGCHGRDGAGSAAFPRLTGQSETYLFASLKAYARGDRHSGFMQAAVSGLTETEMRDLARHYASSRAQGGGDVPVSDGAAGEQLARRGDPRAGIPPCAACHGLADGPRYPAYPGLWGQEAWYIALQLELFRKGERGGTPYAHIMETVAKRLADGQITAVSRFYAGQ